MKRKMRKFRLGGSTDEMGNKAGYEESPPDFEAPKKKSFSEAFREARKTGDATFTWQGKKYTTEVAGSKKSEAPYKPSPSVSSNSKKEPDDIKLPYKFKEEVEYKPSTPRSGGRGSKPGSAKVGTGRYDDPTSSYKDRLLSPFKRLTGGDLFGQRKVERVMKGAGVGTEEARRRLREAGMSGGGRVKKYAGGGSAHSSASRRADGIAKKGKTRGRIV